MSPFLAIVIWLLIPAGLLPVLTAFVLRRYRTADSQSLRDRWHLALVLAILGGVSTFLAANRVWELGFRGEWITISFALVLLAVDVVSGKWLLDFMRGGFDERQHGPETAIQKEDRQVGDTRRELQSKAANEE